MNKARPKGLPTAAPIDRPTTLGLELFDVERPHDTACEFCGCTEHHACGPVPCFWATPTRCSYCVPLRVLLTHPGGLSWLLLVASITLEGHTIDVAAETPPRPENQGGSNPCSY